ncbi:MAG TPA: hypothetical protein VF996_01105 [Candidatus Saccharimonadales bacterium]
MNFSRRLDQKGSMSLLTVIFFALIFTIVTISFVRLAITEQRQSVDEDLTTRAYYAAESGVEDAKRALQQYQSGTLLLADLNGDDCSLPSGYNGDLTNDPEIDSAYTCQLIDLSPANFQAELGPWEAVTIPLNGESAFDRVRIDWHIHTTGASYGRRTNPSNTQLIDVPAWTSGNFPAMLRAGIFSHPSGNFNPTQVNQDVLFINPAASTAVASLGDDGEVVNGSCVAPANINNFAGTYACTVTISGVSAQNFYLRLQSLYTSTFVQVTLLNNNTPVLFEEVQALVDVTGRAGDIFRRVEARVSLLSNNYPLPDIALWSNTDICKAFSVTDDPADYDATACPWQP